MDKRMDNLEKFIAQNRVDFDDKSPSARVWDKIDIKAKQNPKK